MPFGHCFYHGNALKLDVAGVPLSRIINGSGRVDRKI